MKQVLKITLIVFVSIVSVAAQNNECKHERKQPRDKKLIEQRVLKINREYSEMIQRGNASEINCVLAEDYILTDESGKVFTKADDLATYKNRQIEIKSVETVNQKLRIIGNDLVIANTTINFKGNKKDKLFDVTEQCTTIWIWREGRWQIISDHISFVK